jgi:hypothetical protein
VALEHRIVNTLVLRNVCQAFHAWALEEVLRNRTFDDGIGTELEVDFSDIKRLQRKFRKSGGVISRLVEDFPAVRKSGVIIYLGNPGNISNINSVVEMLKDTQLKVFGGVSLWDLDYYWREFTNEFKNLLTQSGPEGETSFVIEEEEEDDDDEEVPNIRPVPNGGAAAEETEIRRLRLSQWLQDAWQDLVHDVYSEDQSIFLTLLSQLSLDRLSCSKAHLPLSRIHYLTAHEADERSIADMIRGCTSVVLREFKGRASFDWWQIKEFLEAQVDGNVHLEEWIQQEENRGPVQVSLNDWEEHIKSWGEWCGMSSQTLEPLDASRVEYRHLNWRNGTTSGRLPSKHPFLTLSSACRALGECIISGGGTGAVHLGEVLKALPPVAKTPKKLIHRPECLAADECNRTRTEDDDSEHTCSLLRHFSNLRILEVQSGLCYTLFEDTVDGVNDYTPVPEQRN